MILYRAKVINYSESFESPELQLSFKEYDVIRETEHFYVILVGNKERRVHKKSKSCYAATNKLKAVNDAYLRSCREKSILKARLKYSEILIQFLKAII
jgi:hypothetical protein